jgi:hypothetical protein
MNPHLEAVIELVKEDTFCKYEAVAKLFDTLTVGGDYYLISHDFQSYLDAQSRIDADYKERRVWAKKSIYASAGMGKFSSDRTIAEYAKEIWNLKVIRTRIRLRRHVVLMKTTKDIISKIYCFDFANCSPFSMFERSSGKAASTSFFS